MRPRFGITTHIGGGRFVTPERWFWTRRGAQRHAQLATLSCAARHVWQVTTR